LAYDDKGCRKLGEFVVNIPNPTDERRYVLVQFIFGDTEIRAKAMERDSKVICKAKLKLMTYIATVIFFALLSIV
jgi:hypothetical protein